MIVISPTLSPPSMNVGWIVYLRIIIPLVLRSLNGINLAAWELNFRGFSHLKWKKFPGEDPRTPAFVGVLPLKRGVGTPLSIYFTAPCSCCTLMKAMMKYKKKKMQCVFFYDNFTQAWPHKSSVNLFRFHHLSDKKVPTTPGWKLTSKVSGSFLANLRWYSVCVHVFLSFSFRSSSHERKERNKSHWLPTALPEFEPKGIVWPCDAPL